MLGQHGNVSEILVTLVPSCGWSWLGKDLENGEGILVFGEPQNASQIGKYFDIKTTRYQYLYPSNY